MSASGAHSELAAGAAGDITVWARGPDDPGEVAVTVAAHARVYDLLLAAVAALGLAARPNRVVLLADGGRSLVRARTLAQENVADGATVVVQVASEAADAQPVPAAAVAAAAEAAAAAASTAAAAAAQLVEAVRRLELQRPPEPAGPARLPPLAERKNVAMSAASETVVAAAVRKRGVVAVDAALPPGSTPLPFAMFEWQGARSHTLTEPQATPLLETHFWAQLRAAFPAGSVDRPTGGLADYCKIADARSAKLTLGSVKYSSVGKRPVVASINGNPDAVITLHAATDGVNGSVLRFACALIDWKTPAEMKSENASRVRSQLTLEALAIRSIVPWPLPVIATDCATSIRVWVLVGHALTEYVVVTVQPDGTRLSRPLLLGEGCWLLARVLLPEAIAAATVALEAAVAEPLSEEEEDDDDENDDSGDDFEGSDAPGDSGADDSDGGGGGVGVDGDNNGVPGGGDDGGSGGGGRIAGGTFADPSSGRRRAHSVGNVRSLLGLRAQKRVLARFFVDGPWPRRPP
jgi:hypothetical protein